ncbi:MAG: SCO7613 C-terminal domain-containing membrane protein, partial [Cellulomonadaceae bacterium]
LGSLLGLLRPAARLDRVVRHVLVGGAAALFVTGAASSLAVLSLDGAWPGAACAALVALVAAAHAGVERGSSLNPLWSAVTGAAATVAGGCVGVALVPEPELASAHGWAVPLAGALTASALTAAHPIIGRALNRLACGRAAYITTVLLTMPAAVGGLFAIVGMLGGASLDRDVVVAIAAGTAVLAAATGAAVAAGLLGRRGIEVALGVAAALPLILAALAEAPFPIVVLQVLALGAATWSVVLTGPARYPVRSLAVVAASGALVAAVVAVAEAGDDLLCAGAETCLSAAGRDVDVSGDGYLLALSLLTVAVVLALVRWWPPAAGRAGLGRQADRILLSSAVLAAVGSLQLAAHLLADAQLRGLLASTGLVMAAAVVLARRPGPAGGLRRGVLLALVLGAVPGLCAAAVRLDLSGPGTAGTDLLILAVLLLTLALAGILAAAVRDQDEPFRTVAALVLPPVLTLVVLAAAGATGWTGRWTLVALAVVVALPAAGARLTLTPTRRLALEVSATATATLLVVAQASHGLTWFGTALVLAAAGAVAWSLTPQRARAVWFGAALLVLGVWALLAAGSVELLEAYTLPAAAVLGGLAALPGRPDRLRDGLVLVATGTAVLPTAAVSAAGPTWRTAATAAAAAVLVAICHLLTRHGGAVGRTGDTAGAGDAAGAGHTVVPHGLAATSLGLVILGPFAWAMGLTLAHSERSGTGRWWSTEVSVALLNRSWLPAAVWVVLAAVLAAGACWALGRARVWRPHTGPAAWGPALVVAMVTAPVLVLLLTDTLHGAVAAVAATAPVLVWGLVAQWSGGGPRRRDFSHAVPALVVAEVVAVLGIGRSAVPADVLLTLAGAAVAVTAVHAAWNAPGRSTWSDVALGVLATVAPTTLLMLVDPQPWRVVLAVALAAGWLFAGLRLRWQAPVALGGAALLTQLVVLAGPPALAALAAVPTAVVLAVVGAALLYLGLSYERQVVRAAGVVRRFADLR